MFDFGNGNSSKRTLGIREKQILYENAKGRCQNPLHNKKISFADMQVGHRTAYSKGGKITLKNALCLCYTCNKLQGTDSWVSFLKKRGFVDPKVEARETVKHSLASLSVTQLKTLAKKYGVKVNGSVEEDFFSSRRIAPTKQQYIAKLSGKVTGSEISSLSK